MKTIEQNTLTAEEYIKLRVDVGWGSPKLEDAQKALDNSLIVFVKRMNAEAVGTIRIIGDGKLCFYIQDLMVLHTMRRKGIARILLQSALDFIDKNAALNAFIGLMAAKGINKFYEEYGFISRPNEHMGPGMIKYHGRPGQQTEN